MNSTLTMMWAVRLGEHGSCVLPFDDSEFLMLGCGRRQQRLTTSLVLHD